MQSDQCGDGALADPLLVQLLHFIVAVLASGLSRQLLLLTGGQRFGRWIRIDRTRDGRIQRFLLLIDVLECVVFALKETGHGRRDIHQEVKTVSNLHCVWCAVPGSFGIGSRPVATDDLHSRVVLEPGRECLRLPIRQHIDDLVPLQVNEDRAVATAFFPCEVVDCQYPRSGAGNWLAAPDQSYERIMADAHAHEPGNPLPHLSSKGTGHFAQRLSLPQRTTSIGGSTGGKPLAEEFALATWIEAAKTAHLDDPLDSLSKAR